MNLIITQEQQYELLKAQALNRMTRSKQMRLSLNGGLLPQIPRIQNIYINWKMRQNTNRTALHQRFKAS